MEAAQRSCEKRGGRFLRHLRGALAFFIMIRWFRSVTTGY